MSDQPGPWPAMPEGPCAEPSPADTLAHPPKQEADLEALDRVLTQQIPAMSLSLDEGAIQRLLARCRLA